MGKREERPVSLCATSIVDKNENLDHLHTCIADMSPQVAKHAVSVGRPMTEIIIVTLETPKDPIVTVGV